MTLEELQKRKADVEASIAKLLIDFSRSSGTEIRDVYFRGHCVEQTALGRVTESCSIKVSIDF